MLISVRTLKFIRQSHLYIGIFITPALLFFALSGALQTFRLHEIAPGSAYKPPAWILTLATIHKHQSLTAPPPKAAKLEPGKLSAEPTGTANASVAQDAPMAAPPAATPEPTSPLPMKIFFLLVSIGLCTSSLTGICMAYRYNRSKPLITALLLAGIIVPLLLLRF